MFMSFKVHSTLWIAVSLILVMLLVAGCGRGGQESSSSSSNQTSDSSSSDTSSSNSSSSSSSEQKSEPKKEEKKSALAGKTITYVVPFSPGGGFDTYARMMAPYLEKYLDATVVVQNVTGAGGIIGANHVYTAQPDGLTIGIMGGTNMIFSQTAEAEGIKYDVGKFTYLGRVSADPNVQIVSMKSPYKTIEDLKNSSETLKVAATGLDDDYFTWSVLAKAFGIENYKMITGWEGNSQWISAMGAGEVHVGQTSAGSAAPAVKNGIARATVQVGEERDQRLPDVPTALEVLSKDNPNFQMVQTLTNAWVADRVVVAPPGVDAAVVKELRVAVEKTLKDSDFLEKANKAGRPVLYKSGEDIQAAIEDAAASVDILKPIFKEAAERIK